MKPHHIGYFVKKMEKSIKEFEMLGYKLTADVVYDKYRDIDICFMENDGYVVELIKPKSENSVVYNLFKKVGVTPYHICYEVDDIVEETEKLRENGYFPTGEMQCAPAINNHNAVFLVNPNMGIIELIENK